MVALPPGVFISRIKPDTPASASGALMRGQQIVAINGQDTLLATKYEVQTMLKESPAVLLEVKYDAEGFAAYDRGEAFLFWGGGVVVCFGRWWWPSWSWWW